MAISLRFNGKKFYDDFYRQLEDAMRKIIDRFYYEATAGMSAEAKADSDNNGIVKALNTYIRAQCAFYADALMESYGTGSLMDKKNNPYFDEYVNSGLYNEERGSLPGAPILGRKKTYTNIYGEKIETSGRNKGKNLEGIYIRDKETGELVYIEPKKASLQIQKAEAWLMQNNRKTYMERMIEQAATEFMLSVKASPMRYFYYVEV